MLNDIFLIVNCAYSSHSSLIANLVLVLSSILEVMAKLTELLLILCGSWRVVSQKKWKTTLVCIVKQQESCRMQCTSKILSRTITNLKILQEQILIIKGGGKEFCRTVKRRICCLFCDAAQDERFKIINSFQCDGPMMLFPCLVTVDSIYRVLLDSHDVFSLSRNRRGQDQDRRLMISRIISMLVLLCPLTSY